MQFDLFVISVFLASGLGFIGGFIACYFVKPTENIIRITNGEKLTVKQQDNIPNYVIPKDPEAFGLTEDINTIQPGIIYRPTAEELEKMHEPQLVKEAKEALAQTFRSEEAPVLG